MCFFFPFKTYNFKTGSWFFKRYLFILNVFDDVVVSSLIKRSLFSTCNYSFPFQLLTTSLSTFFIYQGINPNWQRANQFFSPVTSKNISNKDIEAVMETKQLISLLVPSLFLYQGFLKLISLIILIFRSLDTCKIGQQECILQDGWT